MIRRRMLAVAGGLAILLCTNAGAEEFPGFSVTPPPAGWVQVQRNAHAVVWMRRTDSPALSVGAAVLTQPVSRSFVDRAEFVEWVTASKQANPDPRRFRLISNHVTPADGDGRRTCASYATTVEDSSGGSGQTLRLQVAGLACLHPSAPGRYYDVQYSARMPAGAEPPGEAMLEGRRFLDSFRFEPPPADGDWSLGRAASPTGSREAT